MLLSLLVACGGDGGGEEAASGAPIPAQAGSADIGPAGGAVTAIFQGGATVALKVPAGALAATTTIRIDLAAIPANALTAMAVARAGLPRNGALS